MTPFCTIGVHFFAETSGNFLGEQQTTAAAGAGPTAAAAARAATGADGSAAAAAGSAVAAAASSAATAADGSAAAAAPAAAAPAAADPGDWLPSTLRRHLNLQVSLTQHHSLCQWIQVQLHHSSFLSIFPKAP